jgi:ComF family protein
VTGDDHAMPVACGATLGALLAPPLCWSCGGLGRIGEPLCRSCRGRLHRLAPDPVWLSFVRVWAPVGYSGPARDLVRALKFRGARGVADAMAAQIAANAPPHTLASGTLVPVPLHPARLRSRGFNQAERLASAVGARTGLAVTDCLARSGSRGTQVGRDRRERLRGITGSVRVRGDAPAEAILVDDVVTTGATLAACAEALRAAGSQSVRAVAYARTPGR